MKLYIDITMFITNFFKNKYLSGIQRVVKEVTECFLTDKANEIILLDYSPDRNRYQVIDPLLLIPCFTKTEKIDKRLWTNVYIDFNEFSSGSVFFDMDSVWGSTVKRGFLYPLLKQQGVKIVTLVHDIIPVTHPQYVEKSTIFNFLSYIGACLQYASLTITTTKATEHAIKDLCLKLGIEPVKNKIAPLGSDFEEKADEEEEAENIDAYAKEVVSKTEKYILMVGTIEPRKNHELVLNALENGLEENGIRVIFAGKYGWNVTDLKERIQTHRLLDESLFFFERPNDQTIKYLYENALAVAFPSYNEGFGLPVVEALRFGVPVVVSDIEVMHEVAGDFADYFNNKDVQDFVHVVLRLASDKDYYAKRKEKIRTFSAFSWAESAQLIKDAVMSVGNTVSFVSENTEIKQVVLLSHNSQSAFQAAEYYENFMPFVKELVICMPAYGLKYGDNRFLEVGEAVDIEEYKTQYTGRLELKFIKTTADFENGFLSSALISSLIKNSIIDDVFLLATDHIFPLTHITREDFLSGNKYKAYYCANLEEWVSKYKEENFFHKKEIATLEFLNRYCLPAQMYESHQIQVISKTIAAEIAEQYPEFKTKDFCFESVYFNYGVAHYPDMFLPCLYVTLNNCNWVPEEIPKQFLFEAFHEELYVEGNDFAQYSVSYSANSHFENTEKIMQYYKKLQEQKMALKVMDSYRNYYWYQKGELPSFVICVKDRDNIIVIKPTYIQLLANSFNRIPFVFDKKALEAIKMEKVSIYYWFTNDSGKRITDIVTYERNSIDSVFYMPVTAPDRKERSIIRISFSFNNYEITKTISLAAYLV